MILLLESGHHGVKLSREELDKPACWIDLFVPCCGDYFEANAWSPEEMEKYQRFLAKRKRMESIEQPSLQTLLSAQAEVEGREGGLEQPAQ